MRKFQLYGLGNGLMDIIYQVDDAVMSLLKQPKGSFRMVSESQQLEIIDSLNSYKPDLISGGSVANSVILFSALGGSSAFTCLLGEDQYGHFYRNELEKLGVKLNTQLVKGGMTGTCLVLVTPDAERTGGFCLGVAGQLSAEHISTALVAESEWLLIEGYLMGNPKLGESIILRGIELAKKSGTKVALTLCDPFVEVCSRDFFDSISRDIDLVLGNEKEVMAMAGSYERKSAFNALSARVKNLVMTLGADGVDYRCFDKEGHVDAFKCDPVDLTGAGDAFAGAFLFGLTQGVGVFKAARSACFMARQVISQVGARIKVDPKMLWDEAQSLV